MSSDQRLQVKKDTLWEIHEQKCLVACIEKKIKDNFDAFDKISKAWRADALTIVGEVVMFGREDGGTASKLPQFDRDWNSTIHEWLDARAKLADLQETFQRLIGAR